MKFNFTRILLLVSSILFFSCVIEPADPALLNQTNSNPANPTVLPVLTTTTATTVNSTSSTSGGTITSDGGSIIIARGVVWSTSQNPTIADSKTVDGNGIGSFTSSITNLAAGNTYYVRAYATNANGTAYGNQVAFTTIGGSGGSGFAMTALINGIQFQANTPFGDNNFSSTNIWSYFPTSDYVMLQGRQGGLLGNPEINIWLKKTDIAVGNYTIGAETFNTPPSHFIDLTDNSSSAPGSEYTKDGTIAITEVNTTLKIVKGTFSFRTTATTSDPTAPITFTITNGIFNYKYAN